MSRRAAPHRGLDVQYGDGDGDGNDDGQAARPSKTARKREAQAAQTLGLELASLPAERLAAIALPEALREAIDAYRRTKSHEGRRRQLQYVGKLMRGADEAALREALAAASLDSARATLALHEAERWRAELIADDTALERWLQANPDTDGAQLRRLVQAARRDAAGAAAGMRQAPSLRALYQFIRPRIAAA
ncbi:MAG: ribosome biogenesis factor YjgA [Rubrivivax sp.]